MAEINITFPDGAVKSFDNGSTTEDIAKSISISLAKKAVAGKFNGELVDYQAPLTEDGKIEIVTKDAPEGLTVLRHTASQVLANALHQLYPEMHFGQGEASDDGFSFDTDNADHQVSSDDLTAVEAKMKEIVKANLPISREVLAEADALKLVDGDPYQTQLVKQAAAANDGDVAVYRQGDFVDLSDGVQLSSTGDVKIFKLLSVAGAYWEGKSSNPMLQRVYGTAFFNQKDMDADDVRRQEARERDHR
ncbi:MAG TPA: threonine--tRNA ligase, partial [Lactobacillus sp.]|nr:threonine--tRNA ligase [Lactobacillus sp.]